MDFIPTSKHAILLLFFFFIEMVPVNTCISIENKLCSTAWLLLVSISVYVSVYKHTWSHWQFLWWLNWHFNSRVSNHHPIEGIFPHCIQSLQRNHVGFYFMPSRCCIQVLELHCIWTPSYESNCSNRWKTKHAQFATKCMRTLHIIRQHECKVPKAGVKPERGGGETHGCLFHACTIVGLIQGMCSKVVKKKKKKKKMAVLG